MFLSGCAQLRQKEETNGALQQLPASEGQKKPEFSWEKQLEQAKKNPELRQFLGSDLFFKAADASLKGDVQTAVVLYKYLRELYPKDSFVGKKYAIELIRSGQLVLAKKEIGHLFFDQGLKDSSLGLVLANLHMTNSEYDKAEHVYQVMMKQPEKMPEVCVLMIKVQRQQKKLKLAQKNLNKCQKIFPKSGLFSYQMGKDALDAGKFDLAIKNFDRSLKKEPALTQAVLGKGLILESQQKLKLATKLYQDFVDHQGDDSLVLQRLIQVMYQEENYKNLLPYLERYVSDDPTNLNMKVRLGILYTDLDRYDDAKGVFKEVLAVAPNSDKILYYLASLYQQTANLEEAVQYFNKIPAESDLFSEGQLQIGQILMTQAQDTRNEVVIKRFKDFVRESSIKNAQLKVELYVYLSSFYESVDDVSNAIQTLENIRTEKKYTEGHDFYLASLYEKNQNYQSSRQIIGSLLEKDPNNAHALNFMGYSYLETGEDLAKAYSYLSKAIALKPNDGYIRDSLGWYYYKMGQYEKALIEIKKAHEQVKDDMVIAKHLAIVYKTLKKYNLARKFYVEALKNCKIESEKLEVQGAIDRLDQLRLPASLEVRP